MWNIHCKFIDVVMIQLWGFPGVSVVKNPLSMQETPVKSLDQEDTLE